MHAKLFQPEMHVATFDKRKQVNLGISTFALTPP